MQLQNYILVLHYLTKYLSIIITILFDFFAIIIKNIFILINWEITVGLRDGKFSQ